jgi:hypothetical protein
VEGVIVSCDVAPWRTTELEAEFWRTTVRLYGTVLQPKFENVAPGEYTKARYPQYGSDEEQ